MVTLQISNEIAISLDNEVGELRHENERLRKALLNLMNEYPTRADAMAEASRLLMGRK